MSKFKTISTQVAAQSSATLRHLRSPQMNTNVIGIQEVNYASLMSNLKVLEYLSRSRHTTGHWWMLVTVAPAA
ncbi:hypothetical protein EAH_00047290 [Eimeria acervulina]|uniref:Endonuclease/exonuclease/phosphatase domain-containing protein n=1 Tax=Eimeria acervulina TaxID=5801 RepID=U6GZU8_EIMAC|nr:hypothetical protein EAH_00047290 [Eimeria acervulina]CDI84014.1 hypothetical protein EAH_00047290 [Eimeria acervulina]